MTNTAAFWDNVADRYAKRPIKDVDAYRQTMDRTVAHLSQDNVALEVGCGTGSTALLLADSVRHITATDISANMIDIAKRKARDQNTGNVTFAQGTLFDDTLEKGSFDVILAFNFLHLLENTPEAIQRVHELLKPQGLFISKTDCLSGHNIIYPVILPVMRFFGFAPYVKFLGVEQLDSLITKSNFEIIETGAYPASPPSRFVVARKL